MTRTLPAAIAVGITCALVARWAVPPTVRLAARVRPYVPPPAGMTLDAARGGRVPPGGTRRVFATMARDLLERLDRAADARGDDQIRALLHRAGVRDVTPEAHRARRALGGLVAGALASAGTGALGAAAWVVVVAAVAGFVLGWTRERRQLERRAARRAERARLELYTVNHLLAIQLRTGSGPVQAMQRVVERGVGVVVGEVAEVLESIRAGMPEADALRGAAERTVDPEVARTFTLVASAIERGADLGDALLAMSRDLRDARREHEHQAAVRRRAAMLVPTIAILAPVMLLFVAAPLPSIVLGTR